MNANCFNCHVPLNTVHRIRGFATIPAQWTRYDCAKCGMVIDQYLWYPPIRERSHTTIIVRPGVAA